MPIIQNDLMIPISPETILWRYMDFEKFESLLVQKALFFCRTDIFKDQFEGSVPKRQAEMRLENARYEANLMGWNFDEERYKEIICAYGINHKKEKVKTTVNCWQINKFESTGMWHQYLDSKEGLAIQTKYENIEKALINTTENIYSSKVRYIDYNNDIWYHEKEYPHRNYNFYIPLIHKRIKFKDEKEFRLIHSVKANGDIYEFWREKENCNGLFIPIDINMLIEKIVLPEKTDGNFINKLNSLISSFGYNFNIDQSGLNSKVYY